MRTVAVCKQFFSPLIFKSIRLSRNFSHKNPTETQKSDKNVTKAGASASRKTQFSDAHNLFDELPQWDVVSVTTLISQLARQNRHEEAFYVFSRMLEFEIKPNEFTLAALTHASTALKNLNLGKHLHAYSIKTSFESNVFMGSAILDHYAKLSTIQEAQIAFKDTHNPNVVSYTSLICGYIKNERLGDALTIFKTMPEKNVISWNAMIGGYSQKGHNEDAMNLFINMLRQRVVPTHHTYPCVLSSAGNIAALKIGKSLHASALKTLGNYPGIFISNSLVTFYAKCGHMDDSLLVFHKLPEQNIVSWNALIMGYAQNGKGKDAICFYHNMIKTGIKPNSVTILGLLLACNHSGLVDEGFGYFNDFKLKNPTLLGSEHYACMVDLLSRSGRFLEAKRFIQDLPFDPGIGFWKSLLGGCLIHLNVELGEFAVEKIVGLDPSDVSSYVMVSNAHSAAERWGGVLTIRQKMREKRMKRVPGCSWVEIGDEICVFVNGDRRVGRPEEIQLVLRCLFDHVEEWKIFEEF